MRFKLPALLSIVILFAIAWVNIAPESAFTSDVGLRYLQVQQLVSQEWRSFAIPYPSHFDPNRAYVPYYYAYSVIQDQIYLNISPFFPLLGSFLYTGLGPFGLTILPALGGLVTAWLTYRLARLSGLPRARAAFFITLFATPLIHYSVLFWDHSFATALATTSIYCVALGLVERKGRYFVIGGWFLGATLGQRPEAYTFAIAVGLALVLLGPAVWRYLTAVVGGALAGVLPLWWLQYLWFGHPLGMATAPHLLDYGRPERYPVSGPGDAGPLLRKILLLAYVQPDAYATLGALALVLVGTAVLILSLCVRRFRESRVLAAGLLAVVAGYLLIARFVVTEQVMVPGVVTTFPLIGLSLAYVSRTAAFDRKRHDLYRMVLGTALLFIGLMVVLWPAYGGRQWGSRYLLFAYPLLVYLALYAYESYRQQLSVPRRRQLKLALAVLVLLSLGMQGIGLREQSRRNREIVVLQQEMTSIGSEVIITNNPWLPAQLGSSLDKTYFYAGDRNQLTALLERLVQADIRHVAIIPLEFIPLEIPERVLEYRVLETTHFEFELREES